MKMKRMEMRDITVGEYQFKVRPFGAKDATYIFGDVATWKCLTGWTWTKTRWSRRLPASMATH